MFKSIAEIVDRAEGQGTPVWRVVLAEEVDDSGRSESEVLDRLKDRLQTMREAVLRGLGSDAPSVSGLLGGGARRFEEWRGSGASVMGPFLGKVMSRAQATMEAGYRVFRIGAGDTREGNAFNTRERVHQVARDAKAVREGVGPDGDWAIDFHQRFDFSDGLRACRLIEEYEPYLVEDPVRDEQAREDLPKLRMIRGRLAGYLSGGEQQMLAVGRALTGNPTLLLLDEPSQGLAPIMVKAIEEAVHRLREQHLNVLLVEQSFRLATALADRCYVISKGQIVYEATPDELKANEEVKKSYLGV